MTATAEQKALAARIVRDLFATEPHGRAGQVEAARIAAEQCALAAIIETTERAAKLAETVASIHVERRDDCLHVENTMGALTQARNAQTAGEIATSLRAGLHLKGTINDQG